MFIVDVAMVVTCPTSLLEEINNFWESFANNRTRVSGSEAAGQEDTFKF